MSKSLTSKPLDVSSKHLLKHTLHRIHSFAHNNFKKCKVSPSCENTYFKRCNYKPGYHKNRLSPCLNPFSSSDGSGPTWPFFRLLIKDLKINFSSTKKGTFYSLTSLAHLYKCSTCLPLNSDY